MLYLSTKGTHVTYEAMQTVCQFRASCCLVWLKINTDLATASSYKYHLAPQLKCDSHFQTRTGATENKCIA